MEFSHFVFVDFENVPDVDLAAIAGQAVRVTLLLSKNQKKLSTSLTLQIHRHAKQIELIEVGATGRNALDLVLANYLGQAIERFPTAEFAIVSKDQDFAAMIAHLNAISVVRANLVNRRWLSGRLFPLSRGDVPQPGASALSLGLPAWRPLQGIKPLV